MLSFALILLYWDHPQDGVLAEPEGTAQIIQDDLPRLAIV